MALDIELSGFFPIKCQITLRHKPLSRFCITNICYIYCYKMNVRQMVLVITNHIFKDLSLFNLIFFKSRCLHIKPARYMYVFIIYIYFLLYHMNNYKNTGVMYAFHKAHLYCGNTIDKNSFFH